MLTLEGHEGIVSALAFAPDGETLVSGGKDGAVRIWAPPQRLAELGRHDGQVLCLAFSGDGRLLATGGRDKTGKLWDFATRAPVEEIPPQREPITALAFLPNDQTLTVACGDPEFKTQLARSLFLWDVLNRKPRDSDVYETDGVRALASHVPQRLLAYALDRRELVVRDLVSPTPVCAFRLKDICRSLAFSPDGRCLAAAIDWRIHLFDVARKQERSTLSGHKGIVYSVAFSPDGRTLMSGSGDRTVKCWDPTTGQERQSYTWPIGRIHTVAFAPDGLRAAAGGDLGAIAVWDVEG
jgi:WD40 repeat protein